MKILSGIELEGNLFQKTAPVIFEVSRVLPTVVNDFVELGNIQITNGTFAFQITCVVSDSDFSVAKIYLIIVSYSRYTSWTEFLPFLDSGGYSSNNFCLDIRMSNETCFLRFRRSSGTKFGRIFAKLEYWTPSAAIFTETNLIGTDTAVIRLTSGIYQNIQTNRTGVNTNNPISEFHVVGNSTISGNASGGNLNLNNSVSNLISFSNSGVGLPVFTTRSIGTKIVLLPTLSTSETDYGIGIANGILWVSIPRSSASYAFYAGITEIFRISGNGRVGVRTSSPGTELQVNGGLAVSSSSAAVPDPGAGNVAISGSFTQGTWAGTAITANRGGTGLTAPGVARNVLTSDGTNWTSSPITRFIVRIVSTDYTVLDTDCAIAVDTSGGNRTITLPTAVGKTEGLWRIKKVDSSPNIVTIVAPLNQAIDGSPNVVLDVQNESLDFMPSADSWWTF